MTDSRLAGLDDKCQITAVFAYKIAGDICHPNLSIKVQSMPVCQLINFQIPATSLTPITIGVMKKLHKKGYCALHKENKR